MKLMAAFVIALICLFLLGINELWWRHHREPDELSRKFVHIVAGSFVAFWPYFLSWNQIRVLALAAFIIVAVSKRFNVFKTIHTATRPTWGEAFFALAVGLTTFVTHNPAVYVTALLQMSLADGLAAVIGTKYGVGNDYSVLGAKKSLAGSATFLFVSYIILLSLSLFSTHVAIPWCLTIAFVATILENIGLRGSDNLLVPMFVAFALRLLI